MIIREPCKLKTHLFMPMLTRSVYIQLNCDSFTTMMSSGTALVLWLRSSFLRNNLQDVFSESLALLKILITAPLATGCFSTLYKIKAFLRNAMSQDRLNALDMLSIGKTLVRDMPDFILNNLKICMFEKTGGKKPRHCMNVLL